MKIPNFKCFGIQFWGVFLCTLSSKVLFKAFSLLGTLLLKLLWIKVLSLWLESGATHRIKQMSAALFHMITVLLLQSQDNSDLQQQPMAPKNWNCRREWNTLATFLLKISKAIKGIEGKETLLVRYKQVQLVSETCIQRKRGHLTPEILPFTSGLPLHLVQDFIIKYINARTDRFKFLC